MHFQAKRIWTVTFTHDLHNIERSVGNDRDPSKSPGNIRLFTKES